MNITLPIVTALAYAASWGLARVSAVDFPLHVIGLFWLLVVAPYSLLSIFSVPVKDQLDRYLTGLTVFFFLMVPIFFLAHTRLGLPVSQVSVLSLVGAITLVAVLKEGWLRGWRAAWQAPRLNIGTFLRRNDTLIIALLVYVAIHALNFYFYKFIPEWDGYTDLMRIENALANQTLYTGYRGFFYTAVTVMSAFRDVSPYAVFSFWLILLQTTLVLVIAQLLKVYDVKSKWLQLLALLAPVAIPVLAMETDMIRPQNIVILGLPLYFWFGYQAYATRKPFYWGLSTLILIAGLNYHEFYFVVFGVHILWLVWLTFDRYWVKTRDVKDRYIFGLTVALGFSIASRTKFFTTGLNFFQAVLADISQVSAWRWWFLGRYNSDGEALQVGWPGLAGALKYYGYYLSPLTGVILLALLGLVLFRYRTVMKDKLLIFLLPFLIVFLLFAEVLPRMNFVLLPERFWLLINLVVIVMAVAMFPWLAKLARHRNWQRPALGVLTSCLVLGIAGSLYVAREKGALTTVEEYRAAQWMKANTAQDALFVTQAANGPMVTYFAKRYVYSPDESFFLEETEQPLGVEADISRLEAQMTEERLLVRKVLDEYYIQDTPSASALLSYLTSYEQRLGKLREELELKKSSLTRPLYVLYSHNKFKGLYAQREWWLKSNYYNAKLEKFNKSYELVYNKDDVLIWRVK